MKVSLRLGRTWSRRRRLVFRMQISGIIHILCRDDRAGRARPASFHATSRVRRVYPPSSGVSPRPGENRRRRGTVTGSLRKNPLFAKYAISRDVKSRHRGNWIRQLTCARDEPSNRRRIVRYARQPRNHPAMRKKMKVTRIVENYLIISSHFPLILARFHYKNCDKQICYALSNFTFCVCGGLYARLY